MHQLCLLDGTPVPTTLTIASDFNITSNRRFKREASLKLNGF